MARRGAQRLDPFSLGRDDDAIDDEESAIRRLRHAVERLAVVRPAVEVTAVEERPEALFRRPICPGASTQHEQCGERKQSRHGGSQPSGAVGVSPSALSVVVASSRTRSNLSLKHFFNCGTAIFASGPTRPRAYAACMRVCDSSSFSASVRAGTADFASGPIFPRARAHCARMGNAKGGLTSKLFFWSIALM